MTYYNEIYFALFGTMFGMLTISTIPYYRNNSGAEGYWLSGIPLAGGLSYFLFLLAPHVHRGLLTPANFILVAFTLGPAFLMRHWLGKDSRKALFFIAILWGFSAAFFEYLRLHGNFQQRVLLVVAWLVAACIWTCIEAHSLYQQRKSFYILALIASALLGVIVSVMRLILIFSDTPSNINLYEEPFLQIMLRFVLGVCLVFISVFLITHANERLHWINFSIQQAKDKSESMNEELTQLVRERDHMLMINSRFSTVSSLAMFNSAIVHELSQPLAALNLTLQEAQWRTKTADPSLQTSIEYSVSLVQKIGQMNHSLRNLMMAQKPDFETVALDSCLQDILPILQNEASRRHVLLGTPPASGSLPVIANKVMFERIVFNLVANAMDALSSNATPGQKPHIGMAFTQEIRRDQDHVVLTVTDNGPGFPKHLLSSDWLHFQSTKETGMGVGLILCHYILSTWRGELVLANQPSGGALVQLWIPLSKQANPAA